MLGHRSQGRARDARLAHPDLDAAGRAPRLQSHCPRPDEPGRHYSLARWIGTQMGRESGRRRAPIPRLTTVKRPRLKAGRREPELSSSPSRKTIRWWPSPGTGGRIVGRGKQGQSWMVISTCDAAVWSRQPKRPGARLMPRSEETTCHSRGVCRTAVMMHAVTMHVAKSSARTGGFGTRGRSSAAAKKGATMMLQG